MADEPQPTGEGPNRSLTHSLRRRILRRLHRGTQPSGAKAMAHEMGLEIAPVAYHMKVLANRGTTRHIGVDNEGGEPLYESAVADDTEVLALLEANEAADEGEGERAA